MFRIGSHFFAIQIPASDHGGDLTGRQLIVNHDYAEDFERLYDGKFSLHDIFTVVTDYGGPCLRQIRISNDAGKSAYANPVHFLLY